MIWCEKTVDLRLKRVSANGRLRPPRFCRLVHFADPFIGVFSRLFAQSEEFSRKM